MLDLDIASSSLSRVSSNATSVTTVNIGENQGLSTAAPVRTVAALTMHIVACG
jgi:hypothetical protein